MLIRKISIDDGVAQVLTRKISTDDGVCTSADVEEVKNGPSPCGIQDSNLGHWVHSPTPWPTTHELPSSELYSSIE